SVVPGLPNTNSTPSCLRSSRNAFFPDIIGTGSLPICGRNLAPWPPKRKRRVALRSEIGYWGAPRIFINGGGHVYDCTLPGCTPIGLDPRYLIQCPGVNPGRNPRLPFNRSWRPPGSRLRTQFHMRSKLLRVPAWGTPHSDLVERRLQRYCPRFQGAVRALAMRHSRIADLAVSFPALLFALAVPRSGIDPARAVELAIEGAVLAELAAAADVPMWLRRLAPEALVGPIMTLPDGELFRRQIANHLPRSPKIA